MGASLSKVIAASEAVEASAGGRSGDRVRVDNSEVEVSCKGGGTSRSGESGYESGAAVDGVLGAAESVIRIGLGPGAKETGTNAGER
jgi:hypothetical protein